MKISIRTAVCYLYLSAAVLRYLHYESVVFGHVSLKYLKHPKGATIYRILFPFLILLGSLSTINLVWSIQDCALGLLIIPNVIALVILGPEIRNLLREFTDPQSGYLER